MEIWPDLKLLVLIHDLVFGLLVLCCCCIGCDSSAVQVLYMSCVSQSLREKCVYTVKGGACIFLVLVQQLRRKGFKAS